MSVTLTNSDCFCSVRLNLTAQLVAFNVRRFDLNTVFPRPLVTQPGMHIGIKTKRVLPEPIACVCDYNEYLQKPHDQPHESVSFMHH